MVICRSQVIGLAVGSLSSRYVLRASVDQAYRLFHAVIDLTFVVVVVLCLIILTAALI